MTLLVTGADGFVGTHLVAALGGVPLAPPGFFVDLRDVAALRASVAATQPDEVVHLAARSFVPASFDDPLATFQVNFLGTYNLLAALKAEGFAGRFLYISTGDLYGQVDEKCLPAAETWPTRPRNPYAASKAAAEALCYQWSQTEKFSVIIARPFNHVGAGQDPRFLVSGIAAQIANLSLDAQPRLQLGNMDVTRDYTDVRDIVRAYRILLDHGVSGETYNVCSGIERSVREIVRDFESLIGRTIAIEQDPARMRPAEQMRMVGDNAKIRALGWAPQISWHTTLRDLLAGARRTGIP